MVVWCTPVLGLLEQESRNSWRARFMFFISRHDYDHSILPGLASAGGFPAMTEHVAFLMKDLVLLAVSFYLLREDVKRVSLPATESLRSDKAFLQYDPSLVEVGRREIRR